MKNPVQARILGATSAFPKNRYPQDVLTKELKDHWGPSLKNPNVVDKLHKSVEVEHRYLAMPKEQYLTLTTFEQRNNAFIDVAVELSEQCANQLIEGCGIDAKEISQIIFTTVTGIAAPSVDARLMNRIAFSPHIRRVPLFGLGCVAGASGIAMAADYLDGHPDDLVLLIAVELCSLTQQRSDVSVANIIASGLFGDGSAAVLLGGRNRPTVNNMPYVVDHRAYFIRDSEEVMGWQVSNDGFRIVLNADVPKVAQEMVPSFVDELLLEHQISRNDVAVWFAHPGGPKVISALEEGLDLKPEDLQQSRAALRDVGNLSSASVLYILEKTLAKKKMKKGDYGVLLAMGPGFCAEVVLLKW